MLVVDTLPVADVLSISFKLYDAPNFSADVTGCFWLSEDTATDIEPGTSPLRWEATALRDGVGTQVSPMHLLGTGAYVKTANDTQSVYALSLPAAAKPYLLAQINSAGKIRLVVTPAEDTVAATYAGYNNANIRPPRLEMQLVPVPEPASVAVLLLGVGGLAGASLRRRAR